jgi:hypothetical protein
MVAIIAPIPILVAMELMQLWDGMMIWVYEKTVKAGI